MRKYELYTAQLQALSKQDKIREHERTCADGSTVRDVAKGSQDSPPPHFCSWKVSFSLH